MHLLSSAWLSLFLFVLPAPGWLGVYLSGDSDQAVVEEVIPDSPAARAGVRAGDVLLAVDDTATPRRQDLIDAIQSREAGTKVRLKLRRGDRERVVVVQLGERAPEGGAGGAAPEAPAEKPAKPEKPAPAGELRARDVPAETGRGFLGLSVRDGDGGVVIDRVLDDGPAAGAGLAAGDVIRSIGDHRIGTLTDLDRALSTMPPGRRVAIGVTNGEGKRSVLVELGRRPGSLPDDRAAAEAAPAEVEIVETPAEKPATEKPATDKPATDKPAPARARTRAARRSEPEFDLEKELQELRAELKELRRMLEELKKQGAGR
jgi:predicted metalloprotease with PDZ domain